ncbi:D-3-phosphoglycerate dehydrogenase [Blastomyces parvus]|uniref:D-3-phosphoglycerate dehydrogenase n=1 Tax=Blastomyces parvus TaxID=2060905 RepID=A0A2B7WL48_9EURO|nr:D-3-phosphoglycerate dehydrogenase [Blastomyces parvus]
MPWKPFWSEVRGKRAFFVVVHAFKQLPRSDNVTGPFDTELLDVLPKTLKFICHNGAGYDNIDIATCTKKQIRVSSTPGAVAPATADIAIFLMIGALRQAWPLLDAVRAGRWRGESGLGHDPQGKVLGILGMGGIGTEVARRAKAFGMEIIYHNRARANPEPEGTKYVTFDELLSQSDVISLNCTLTDQTRHIIGKREFMKMKEGVVIVNTARGAVIDEKALVEALETNKVASVGLDVYEDEPKIPRALREHPRAFLLPHIGTFTCETQKKMEELVLRNLKSCWDTDELVTMVPEQKGIFL